MLFDAALLNTQHHNVRNKGKVEQSKSSAPPFYLVVVTIEKEALGSPSTKVANFTDEY